MSEDQPSAIVIGSCGGIGGAIAGSLGTRSMAATSTSTSTSTDSLRRSEGPLVSGQRALCRDQPRPCSPSASVPARMALVEDLCGPVSGPVVVEQLCR